MPGAHWDQPWHSSSLEHEEEEQEGQLLGQPISQDSHIGLRIQEGHPRAGLTLCSQRTEVLNHFIFEFVSEVQWDRGCMGNLDP